MRGPSLAAWALLSAGIPVALAVAAPGSRVFDSGRAYRDLEHQCRFGPRVPGTQAHEQCAQWLEGQLRACTDEVTRQEFDQQAGAKKLRVTNLIATFNPRGKRHVLLCAHWDSRPFADRDPEPAKRVEPVPGANDGASGVAVLLEIARALKARPPRTRVTIALFDGEDYGLRTQDMFLGSRHFSTHFHGPPVDWAVLLDMVGDRDLRLRPEQISLREARQVVDRIWGAAERAGCSAFVREAGPAVMDDHVFLLQAGIPCVDVIDFDYAYWHTVADTPDKCSAASLEQVGRAVLRAIAEEEGDP
jgi:hypothetical protein